MLEFINGDFKDWAIANRKSGRDAVERLTRAFGTDFGSTRLDDITGWSIEKWRSRRIKEGISPSTVNRYINKP